MIQTPQDAFLRQASAAARAAGHIFPDYAAAEAALESTWGRSRLAREANNLFGQKQSLDDAKGIATPGATAGTPGTAAGTPGAPVGVLAMPTQEFLHGQWVTVIAHWARFVDQAACFRARMALLRRLQQNYPAYGRALTATTGEAFIEEVSRAWSTDPERAEKVLAIHRQHCASFLPLAPQQVTGRSTAVLAHV
jgi:flagellum-specific peptidoglycan hydrolase FlgJ